MNGKRLILVWLVVVAVVSYAAGLLQGWVIWG